MRLWHWEHLINYNKCVYNVCLSCPVSLFVCLFVCFSLLLILFFDRTLYDKKLVAAYAGRMSVQQFEAKCQGKLWLWLILLVTISCLGKPVPIERKNVTKSNHIKPPLTMSSGGVPTAPFRPPPMGG